MDFGTALPDDPDLRERVRVALEASLGRVSLLVAPDGTVLWATPSLTPLTGHLPSEVVGGSLFDLYEEAQARYSRAGFAQIVARPDLDAIGHGVVPRNARVRHADGRIVSVDSFASPMLADERVRAVLIEWFPVSDPGCLIAAIDSIALGRPPAETMGAAVRLTESLVPGLVGGIAIWQEHGWSLEVPLSGVDGVAVAAVLPPPTDPAWDEPCFRAPDVLTDWLGEDRGLISVVLRGTDGEPLGVYVGVRRGVDTLRPIVTTAESLFGVALRMAALSLAHARSTARLKTAAETDPLTGLLNRAGLRRAVDEVLAEDPEAVVVALCLDLDDFKPVNDVHGHAVGDQVLLEVARRLRTVSRQSDVLVRLGGDEFAILVPVPRGAPPVDAERFGQRIHAAVNFDGLVPGTTVRAAGSVGVASGLLSDLDLVLKQADTALYVAKNNGKGGVVLAGADASS